MNLPSWLRLIDGHLSSMIKAAITSNHCTTVFIVAIATSTDYTLYSVWITVELVEDV